MIRRVVLGFVFGMLALTGVPRAASQQVYRAATDAVIVDVAVLDGNQPVGGLTAKDFSITDNRVTQVVRDASVEQAPLDVTLVIDLSGSISPPQLDELVGAIKQVGDVLRPADRCRVVVFAQHVAERAALGPWPVPIDLSERDRLGGMTALFDATAIALLSPPAQNHRKLVIALTDGDENSSVINSADLIDAAKYGDSVLDIILAPRQAFANARYATTLSAATEVTGGRQVVLNNSGDIGAALRASIDAMHASYVVRYVLDGVPLKGWHDVNVRVTKRGRFLVRARKGYFGG